MPKIRFQTDDGAHLYKRGALFASLAIDTDKVAAYQLTQNRGDLHIWFEGVADSVIVTHPEIGEDNFYALVQLLEAQFTKIDKLPTDQ